MGSRRTALQRSSGYDPPPLDLPPLFQSSPKPLAMCRWLVTKFLWPQSMLWIAISVVTYHFLTPGLDRFRSLDVIDVLVLWVRNAALMLTIIGGQHWWLHIRKSQGLEFKYESRWLSQGRKLFTFNHQTRDNMFWTLVSGGAVAASFEACMFRLYSANSIPQIKSVWLIALMTFAVFWIEGIHFYLNHRLLHWRPLYRSVHSLHHRNVNTGPWSGISMHPVEHLLYFSLAFVFVVVPGSPFVATFCMVYLMLSPSPSHSGFHRFVVNEGVNFHGGDLFHNLHHRYFEVNYGMLLLPLDKWFGTFHDGSVEAHDELRGRRQSNNDAAVGSQSEKYC
ncbi:MAG: desaturase [Acidimicrobiaceae bacterium]|nr:desaturase [Acidimicrobiaceae bacterium]